jgi:hypothetical protein
MPQEPPRGERRKTAHPRTRAEYLFIINLPGGIVEVCVLCRTLKKALMFHRVIQAEAQM